MTIRMVVVLPAPLAPTKPVIWPAGTSNVTWSTAVVSPNRLVSSRISNMAPTLGGGPDGGSPARRNRPAAGRRAGLSPPPGG